MVLYAREDVVYVNVPVTSGGCGQAHTRPVIDGVPQQFKLECQGCENFLRADIARTGNKKVRTINGDTGLKLTERYLGLWGASPDTIPETPDAELKREHDEQASITKNAASQTETFAQIGQAIAGNTELMAKFIELQMELAKTQGAEPHPVVARAAGLPISPPSPDYSRRDCVDCGTAIQRQPGQKGYLPSRCPDCKARKPARRKVA